MASRPGEKMCDADADKPFICSLPSCGMMFATEDHLNMHGKKHEMSLAVHPGGPSSSFGAHVADQTPTPTKFLKNCEEISLFQELTNNPFEEAFKKASDAEGLPPFPGPHQATELNTPVLPPSSSFSDKSPQGAPLYRGGIHSLDNNSPPATTTPTTPSSLLRLTAGAARLGTERGGGGGGFAMDLSGQKSRESSLLLLPAYSGSERGCEEGRGGVIAMADSAALLLSSSSSPSKSMSPSSLSFSSSIIPLVSATEVMLGQGVESSFAGSMAADSDQGMTSASAAVPQSGSGGDQQGLMTSIQPPTSSSSSSSSCSSSSSSSQDQQACAMQVYLQLPTSHTVPVHLPGSSGSGTLPEGSVTPQHPQQQPPTHSHPSVATLPTQTAELGAFHHHHHHHHHHQGAVTSPDQTSSSAGSPKVALKQRLKQSLQAQQAQPDAISPGSSSGGMSEGGGGGSELVSPLATTPLSPSTQLLLNSPSGNFNLADLEPVSKRPKNGSIDTDDPEERREKFLERNRAAAARCRHKRKQWIVNLEKKADELQQTNSKLQGEVGLLKGEVAQLKTLLLAHQNCPITMHNPISLLESSSSSLPLDIGQLISPGTSTTLTPVDSQEIGAVDPAAFAFSTFAEN
ncbi:hypothetical protein ACOMHN_035517 [Nucella lapillus]